MLDKRNGRILVGLFDIVATYVFRVCPSKYFSLTHIYACSMANIAPLCEELQCGLALAH